MATSLKSFFDLNHVVFEFMATHHISLKADVVKLEERLEESDQRFKQLEKIHQEKQLEAKNEGEEFRNMIKDMKGILVQKDKEIDFFREKFEEIRKGGNKSTFYQSKYFNGNNNSEGGISEDDAIFQMKEKIQSLANLTCSYIRGIYDHCIEQERLIEPKNNVLSNSNSKSMKGNLKIVIHHLNCGKDSKKLDWDTLLKDEVDRRLIFGNLTNRLQMGIYKISNLLKTVSEEHKIECTRLSKAQERILRDLTQTHEKRMQTLADSLSKYKQYGQLCDDKILEITQMNEEIKNRNCTLQNQCISLESQFEEKQRELHHTKNILMNLKNVANNKEEELMKVNKNLDNLSLILM